MSWQSLPLSEYFDYDDLEKSPRQWKIIKTEEETYQWMADHVIATAPIIAAEVL